MLQVWLRRTGAADSGFQTIVNNVESSKQNRPTLPSSVSDIGTSINRCRREVLMSGAIGFMPWKTLGAFRLQQESVSPCCGAILWSWYISATTLAFDFRSYGAEPSKNCKWSGDSWRLSVWVNGVTATVARNNEWVDSSLALIESMESLGTQYGKLLV